MILLGINKKLKEIRFKYNLGKRYLENEFHIKGIRKSEIEINKLPLRTDIINYILKYLEKKTVYLEIGVRRPEDNFNHIISDAKYGVDPGYENEENNVDFKMTSDEFFKNLRAGKILSKNIRFDVIFIDGQHLAEQVEKDIQNALEFVSEKGFIVLHDCNPPTEFHASENYYYRLSPSGGYWNGTTWKSFFKLRKRNDLFSCCIDSDWGIGIVSRKINLGLATKVNNDFFEFNILDSNRKASLNLISFEEFRLILERSKNICFP